MDVAGSVSVLGSYLWCREVDCLEMSNQQRRFIIIIHSHASTHGIIYYAVNLKHKCRYILCLSNNAFSPCIFLTGIHYSPKSVLCTNTTCQAQFQFHFSPHVQLHQKCAMAFECVSHLVDNGCGSVGVLGSYLWCIELDILEISNQSRRFRIIMHSYTSTHKIICICVCICMWFVFMKMGYKSIDQILMHSVKQMYVVINVY